MSIEIDKIPVYDAKVKAVLQGLAQGKTREELAKELNYSSYRSLDMYMRRRNFVWNRKEGTYEPPKGNYIHQPKPFISKEMPAKVRKIVTLIERESDPKSVAELTGFEDHREMAAYLKSQGYRWSSEINNYVGSTNQDDSGLRQVDEECEQGSSEVGTSLPEQLYFVEGTIESYIPLLKLLAENKGKLFEALGLESSQVVPRYVVPGIFVTKSVHMSSLLDRMVRDYSEEKNISQREIFEVALVDFFKKYGYTQQIQTLLERA